MRRTNWLRGAGIAAFAALAVSAACGGNRQPGEVSELRAEPEDHLVEVENTLCPVMGAAVVSGQAFEWMGFRIGICCPGCENAFESDPQTFIPFLLDDPGVSEAVKSMLSDHLESLLEAEGK
jgi:hypothetical protein